MTIDLEEAERLNNVALRRHAHLYASRSAAYPIGSVYQHTVAEELVIPIGYASPIGLVDQYKRSGDPLFEFGEVLDLLQVDRAFAIRRFVASAAHGGFGEREFPARHAGKYRFVERRAVERLVDLVGASGEQCFAPTHYYLRPTSYTVGQRPEAMRARKSVWAAWIEAQEWPVPVELGGTPPQGLSRYEAALAEQKAKAKVEDAPQEHASVILPFKPKLGAPPDVAGSVVTWWFGVATAEQRGLSRLEAARLYVEYAKKGTTEQPRKIIAELKRVGAFVQARKNDGIEELVKAYCDTCKTREMEDSLIRQAINKYKEDID